MASNLQFILDPDTGDFIPNPDYVPPRATVATPTLRPRGFQMPHGAPSSAIADTVAQALVQGAPPRPMAMPDIPGVTTALPPAGGTQGFQMPPAQQMTDTPSFMQRMLQSIYDNGGIKPNLGSNPRGADAFFQNLLAGGFNAAATGANRKREEFNATNEALKAQNIKDRDATRAAQKTSDEKIAARLKEKQDRTEAEEAWLRRYKVEQEGRVELARIGASSRETVAGMRGTGGVEMRTLEDFGFTPAGFDKAVTDLVVSGRRPTSANRKEGAYLLGLMYSRAAELFPDANLAANVSDYKALSSSRAKVRQMYDAVSSFEKTAMGNARRLAQMGSGIPELNSKWLNTPVREFVNSATTSPEMAAYKLQFSIVQKEYARILNTANLLGVITDEARRDMERAFSDNLPLKSVLRNIEVLDADAKTRLGGMEEQLAAIDAAVRQMAQTPDGRKQEINEKVVAEVNSLRSQGVDTLAEFNALLADPQNRAEMRDEMGGDEGIELARRTFAAAGRRK